MIFFFQAEDGIRDLTVTGVQTCALPISWRSPSRFSLRSATRPLTGSLKIPVVTILRSEEHTSELQSQSNLVCRLLLEKKKKKKKQIKTRIKIYTINRGLHIMDMCRCNDR